MIHYSLINFMIILWSRTSKLSLKDTLYCVIINTKGNITKCNLYYITLYNINYNKQFKS